MLSRDCVRIGGVLGHALPLGLVRVVGASRWALFVELLVLLVFFLVIVVVEDFATHQGHRTLHQHFLVLGGGRKPNSLL